MFDYQFNAIPTAYRGVRYRSRLEARWAAFFDIVGWQATYEPFDFGAWSPDFLLAGATEERVLVEVKPISAFDAEVASKMTRCATAARFTGELLLLGIGPLHLPYSEAPGISLGWLDDGELWDETHGQPRVFGQFVPAAFSRFDDGLLDFSHSVNSYHGRMTGNVDGDHGLGDHDDYVLAAWAKATNAVQWHAAK